MAKYELYGTETLDVAATVEASSPEEAVAQVDVEWVSLGTGTTVQILGVRESK